VTAPDRERDRLGPERLLAFSDGVVAIALTLLVLPLAELVPDAAESNRSGLTIITENLAPIGSFVLSFAVIARFWAAHHRVFDDAPRVPPRVVWFNTVWLFTIVVLPFPTEMLGTFTDDPFTLRFYVATLFASSALLTVMTVLVARSRTGEDRARAARRGSGGTAVLLLVIFLVTLVLPGLGYWPLLLLFATSPVERLTGPLLRRVVTRS
jgi:uncharacterized membrane protein